MKLYTIIGGVNGAGKSSLTGVLRAEKKDLGIIIDVDKITAKLDGDKLQGGKESIRLIDECLAKGICFTQETTLSGQRTIKTSSKAIENDYYVRLYYIGLDSSMESLKRIKNRVEKGGHNIPQEDVLRRFRSRYDDIKKLLPYCDEAVFYDNENGFVAVGEYVNGELILKGNYRPQWAVELEKYLK